MIIAQVLRNKGYKVLIHDAALEGWTRRTEIDEKTVVIGQSDEEIAKVIEDSNPDVVCISALFSNLIESANDIARLAKKVKPEVPVILGGNHISNAITDYKYNKENPHPNVTERLHQIENPNIDFAMYGEVDFELPKLIDYILNGKDLKGIPGLVMQKSSDNESYHINPAPLRINDIGELPLPARDLVNMEGYFDIGAFHSAKSKSNRVLSVMASRGCPEKCTFCTTPQMWGSIVRWRKTESIITEIKEGKEMYNIGEIQFEDDTITAHKKNLLELCKELEKIGIPWCTPNGTKTNYHSATQPELYKAMADSGCYQITLACESGVQRVLDHVIRKNLKIEQIKPAIENAKKAGMLVHTFWILGYPGETYEEMQHTVEFAMESGADSFSFAILSPLPGTPIYRQVMRENLWWPGRDLKDLMYRSSLIKVDGFESPSDFEKFVTDANVKCNKILAERDPERFKKKYGNYYDERDLEKQT